jgi:hypothetical protein
MVRQNIGKYFIVIFARSANPGLQSSPVLLLAEAGPAGAFEQKYTVSI